MKRAFSSKFFLSLPHHRSAEWILTASSIRRRMISSSMFIFFMHTYKSENLPAEGHCQSDCKKARKWQVNYLATRRQLCKRSRLACQAPRSMQTMARYEKSRAKRRRRSFSSAKRERCPCSEIPHLPETRARPGDLFSITKTPHNKDPTTQHNDTAPACTCRTLATMRSHIFLTSVDCYNYCILRPQLRTTKYPAQHKHQRSPTTVLALKYWL